jgi:hypothetical protein
MTVKTIILELEVASSAADSQHWSPDRWRRELSGAELQLRTREVDVRQTRIKEVQAHA